MLYVVIWKRGALGRGSKVSVSVPSVSMTKAREEKRTMLHCHATVTTNRRIKGRSNKIQGDLIKPMNEDESGRDHIQRK